jgi:hypothetical protein
MKYTCKVQDPVATVRLMRLFGWYVPLTNEVGYNGYPHFVVEGKCLINGYKHDSVYLKDLLAQNITEKDLVKYIVTGIEPPNKISWSEVKIGETVYCGGKYTKVNSLDGNIYHNGVKYGVIVGDLDAPRFSFLAD